MLILVLNSGSSSLKYQLFNTNTERAIAKGVADKIGLADSCVEHTVYLELETSLGIEHRKKKDTIECTLQNSRDALAMVIKLLTHPDLGVIHDLSEISAVGHRIVHGGDLFSEAVELTPENLRELAKLNPLAPLHNPPALLGVQACLDVMPDVPNVGVFDTAFHQTMPPEAFMYSALWFSRHLSRLCLRSGYRFAEQAPGGNADYYLPYWQRQQSGCY